MRFEWDEKKNRANQRKHGVSFQLAARVFADEFCLVYRDRIDEHTGEQRWHALGRVGGLAVYHVIHVFREATYAKQETIRIISARAADKRECRRYFQQATD
jgi:uncharacterized protein